MASRCARCFANAWASSTLLQKPSAQFAAPSKKAIRRIKPGVSLAALEVRAT
jgi:hypothetical protein